MAFEPQNDPTTLDQTFHYENATHSYDIAWCSLGTPENPPVVFIHGTPWSSRVWIPFALALSRQFHVFLCDNTGFGESPLERKLNGTTFGPTNEVERLDSDLARQSEVFAALYKSWEREWGDRKAHVIAHDHAGLMSLRSNLLHGCQYASLCLIDVVAIGPFGQDMFKKVAADPQYFEEQSYDDFDAMLDIYISNAAFHILSKETMHQLKAPWLRKGGKAGFVRQLCQANSRSTEAVEARYAEVGQSIPVKIVWGADDNWIPVETAFRLGEALHAKEIVTIERGGHLLMYDQPAQLGIELASWLHICEA